MGPVFYIRLFIKKAIAIESKRFLEMFYKNCISVINSIGVRYATIMKHTNAI